MIRVEAAWGSLFDMLKYKLDREHVEFEKWQWLYYIITMLHNILNNIQCYVTMVNADNSIVKKL